jgi:glycosyltransferase involved in cell wall biosynthesis
LSRLHALLRELRPDVAVAFMTEANVVALLASLGLGVPVVISERNQPDLPGLGKAHKLARHLSYPMACAIVVQNDAIASWARARYRVPIYVIPNPIVLADEQRHEPDDIHQIVSLGRLTPQKGFDVLVKSFSALVAKHPDWRLTIYGEGPDRANLELLRAESRCPDRIALPGLTKDSASVLRRASLFVLPSRFEGYPNALLEALNFGLPVIATACPGGTAEILANGVHGMLLPPNDVTALTTALDVMMSSRKLRMTYSSRARSAVMGLDVEVVGSRWLDVLAGVRC